MKAGGVVQLTDSDAWPLVNVLLDIIFPETRGLHSASAFSGDK